MGSFDPDRCTVIEDPQDFRELYRGLKNSAKNAKDTLLVYYSGHGHTGTRLNDLYLCTGETDLDELRITALAYDHVREILLDCDAKNKVIILDCCFSGRAIADLSARGEGIAGQATIAGTYVLVATPPNAVALAPDNEDYTAFTAQLIEGLAGGAAPKSRFVTLDSLYRFTRDRLKGKGFPTPHQRGSDTVTDLALMLNPSYAERPRASDSEIERMVLSAGDIQNKIAELAEHIDADYRGRNLLMLGLLKGGFRFATDLATHLTFSPKVDYVDVGSRYAGEIRLLKDSETDIAGQDVLIVDNIFGDGAKLAWLSKHYLARGAASVEFCVLMRMPEEVRVLVPVRYVGFDIPKEDVVGYSLERDDGGRLWNLPYVAVRRAVEDKT